jgi:Ca-activated chloride channel family protein
MYRLEQPVYFYLFAILPIIWLGYFWVLWWKKRTQKKFAETELLKKLSPDKSVFKSLLKMIILSLGFSFLIIGLVNPKMGTALKTVKRSGVDIVFALDVSKSMLAEDVAPSRLEKSKLIVSKIIDKLGSDRVGIIIYAGNAYPLLPITTDHAAAKMFLQNAHPNLVSSQGTAIGQAIKLAQTYYDNDEQTNRFLFIISDGEDHGEDAATITKQAKEQAIKTYTIGLGTRKGGPIPINQNGNILYKKDKEGNMVITQLHDDILKEIAQVGNGQYIDGNKTKEAVKFVEDLIVNADKKEFETKEFSDYKDQFQWFIGLGLLFILIDVFLLEKKTKWIQKLNLFDEKE